MRSSKRKFHVKKTSDFKVMRFLLAIFLLSLGILFGEFFWQNKKDLSKEKVKPEPVVNECRGKVYQNKEKGYEVCIPYGWYYKEFGAGKETVGFDERPIPFATDYLGRFVVRVENKSLEQAITEVKAGLAGIKEGPPSSFDKLRTTEGQGWKKIEGTIASGYGFFNGGQEMAVLMEGNRGQDNETFEFIFMNTADGYISQLPMFLDFINNFHFIKAEPSFVSSESGNITVTSPLPNSIISSPVLVKGKARVFENVVSIRLEDSEGNVLTRTTAYAKAREAGLLGEFETTLYFYPPVPPSEGTLVVFQASPKDGSETDIVKIALRFR